MNLTVEIPDDLVGQLTAAGGDLSRHALEALVLEECKSGHLTKDELRRLLGFEIRYELDGFLKAGQAWGATGSYRETLQRTGASVNSS